jgi:hypothetical protein
MRGSRAAGAALAILTPSRTHGCVSCCQEWWMPPSGATTLQAHSLSTATETEAEGWVDIGGDRHEVPWQEGFTADPSEVP